VRMEAPHVCPQSGIGSGNASLNFCSDTCQGNSSMYASRPPMMRPLRCTVPDMLLNVPQIERGIGATSRELRLSAPLGSVGADSVAQAMRPQINKTKRGVNFMVCFGCDGIALMWHTEMIHFRWNCSFIHLDSNKITLSKFGCQQKANKHQIRLLCSIK